MGHWPIKKFNYQSRYCHASLRSASVCPSSQTLRCAQGDKTFPILVVKLHYRPALLHHPKHREPQSTPPIIHELLGV